MRPQFKVVTTGLLLLVCGLMVAGGFVAGRWVVQDPDLTFDARINVVALAQLVSTVLIAAVISRDLDQRKHSDQLRKKAALDRLQVVVDTLKALQGEATGPTPSYGTMVRLLKDMYEQFRHLTDCTGLLAFPPDSKARVEFESSRIRLRALLTDTPSKNSGDSSATVHRGAATFQAPRQAEIHNVLGRLRKSLLTIELAIILHR